MLPLEVKAHDGRTLAYQFMETKVPPAKSLGTRLLRIGCVCRILARIRPSLFVFFMSTSMILSKNVLANTIEPNASFLLTSDKSPLPTSPVFTPTDAFGLIFLYTTNFDKCGMKATGEKFRSLLEIHYKICIGTAPKNNLELAQLQQDVQQIDDELENQHRDEFSTECRDFEAKDSTKMIAQAMNRITAEQVTKALPQGCQNYGWMSE